MIAYGKQPYCRAVCFGHTKKDGLGSTQTILRISFWLEEDGR